MTRDVTLSDSSAQYRIPVLIGVVGHRDLLAAETDDIRTSIAVLLTRLRDSAPDVQLKLLSSMADGADLLTAEVASSLGIDVIALLPYSLAQCRRDLDSESARTRFDCVMTAAERLELPLPDGAPADTTLAPGELRDAQYQRAGALIAQYSTLLIAIWDGLDTEHRAGTARVLDCRRRGGVSSNDESRSVGRLLGRADNDLVYEIRCGRVNGHGNTLQQRPPVGVIGFVTGTRQLGGVERGIPDGLATLLARTGAFNRDVEQYGTRIAGAGRRLAPASPLQTALAVDYIDRLFMAADWLGVHFRGRFMRALRMRYILWALFAFLLLAFKKEHEGSLALIAICGVLLMFGIGWALAFWANRRRWHQRYLDYRALAEGLRVDFYCTIAGVRSEVDPQFAHQSFLQQQDVELEWIRAAMRAVSLRCALFPQTIVPHGFSHAYAAWVGDADPINGSGQRLYYQQRLHSLERRLEIAEFLARGMLVSGLAFGVLLAVDTAMRLLGRHVVSEDLRTLMTWGLAVLTVYGAIFEIYLSEKADRALIRQYQHMDAIFSAAAAEMRSAKSSPEQLDVLRALGRACLTEHAQWTLAHRDKRIDGLRW